MKIFVRKIFFLKIFIFINNFIIIFLSIELYLACIEVTLQENATQNELSIVIQNHLKIEDRFQDLEHATFWRENLTNLTLYKKYIFFEYKKLIQFKLNIKLIYRKQKLIIILKNTTNIGWRRFTLIQNYLDWSLLFDFLLCSTKVIGILIINTHLCIFWMSNQSIVHMIFQI